jgi:hypothetical protein
MQTINERRQELARRTREAMADLAQAIGGRGREERGQISAEFMGLLFIAALVIGAIVALDIHTLISEAVETFIENIKSGDKPEGG